MTTLFGFGTNPIPVIPTPLLEALIILGITYAVMSPHGAFANVTDAYRREIGIAGTILAWAVLGVDLLDAGSLMPRSGMPAALGVSVAIAAALLVVLGTVGVLRLAMHRPHRTCASRQTPQPR